VASHDSTGLQLGPRSLRGRADRDIRPLAAVPQPRCQLPLRLRVRGATMTDIGIIGAGRLGQAMARVAVRAGRSVLIANSRGPESLASIASVLGETVSAGSRSDAAAAATVVIAVPWDRVREAVNGLEWKNQVVIDATNDWA